MKTGFLFIFLVGFFSLKVFGGTVDTLKIHSPEMDKDIYATVIVPDNYYQLKGAHYPVLYLLHGFSGDYLNWITLAPRLKEYVDEFNMIVVAPDGGYDSWYFDSPVDDKVQYESFITQTLIPAIDVRYRTLNDRRYRGIAGLSMGGHGALYLAIRHLDLFGAAASFSGGVDLRPFPDNWNIKNRLGKKEDYPDNWEQNSVINLVNHLKDGSLKLFIDIGVDDFFLEVNRALHQKLLHLKIAHDYIERPGGHTWSYWRNALPYEMLFFRDFFYNTEKK